MEWKKGSVVRLKSGGPNMTVQQVSGLKLSCSWFDDNKMIQSAIFAPESLVNGDEPLTKSTVNFVAPMRGDEPAA